MAKLYLSKEDYLADLKSELEDRAIDTEAELSVSDLILDVDDYFESGLNRSRSLESMLQKLGSPEQLAEKFLAKSYMRPRFRRAYDFSRVTSLGLALNALWKGAPSTFLKTNLLLMVFVVVFNVCWFLIGSLAFISLRTFAKMLMSFSSVELTPAFKSMLFLSAGGVCFAVFLAVLGMIGSGRLFRLAWVWVRSQVYREGTLIEDAAR